MRRGDALNGDAISRLASGMCATTIAGSETVVRQLSAWGHNWYRRAADAGNADGMFGLAALLVNGRLVKEDLLEAAYWLQKSADLGGQRAIELLPRVLEAMGKDGPAALKRRIAADDPGKRLLILDGDDAGKVLRLLGRPDTSAIHSQGLDGVPFYDLTYAAGRVTITNGVVSGTTVTWTEDEWRAVQSMMVSNLPPTEPGHARPVVLPDTYRPLGRWQSAKDSYQVNIGADGSWQTTGRDRGSWFCGGSCIALFSDRRGAEGLWFWVLVDENTARGNDPRSFRQTNEYRRLPPSTGKEPGGQKDPRIRRIAPP